MALQSIENSQKQRRNHPLSLRLSVVSLSAFLCTQGRQSCSAFSMVAPPMPPRQMKAPTRNWKTNTYVPPADIVERVTMDKMKDGASSSEKGQPLGTPSLSRGVYPAHASPLFRTEPKSKSSDSESFPSKITRIGMMSYPAFVVRQAASFLADETTELLARKEHQEFLTEAQTGTIKLNRAMSDVLAAQDNLQYLWDIAGEAVVAHGLIQTKPLKLGEQWSVVEGIKP